MIERNLNQAGRRANVLFGIAEVLDGLVRVCSAGFPAYPPVPDHQPLAGQACVPTSEAHRGLIPLCLTRV